MNSFKNQTCVSDTSRMSSNPLIYLEEFQECDSGWASWIMNFTININNKYNLMRVSCRFEVPREIMTKRAVINVRSMGNVCFAWSVITALYPAERNTDRESSYPHDGAEFSKYRISYNVKRRNEIRISQRRVYWRICYRRTENAKCFSNMTHWKGETYQFTIVARSARRQCGLFRMNQARICLDS